MYYGEEIGMQGGILEPFKWSNASQQTDDPGSLLSHYRSLITLRKAHPALRVGDLNIVSTGNPGLFASLRISSTEAALMIINLTNTAISNYRLSLNKSTLQRGSYIATPLMGQGPFVDLRVNSQGGFANYIPLTDIPAYATLIVQLSPK